MKKKLVFTVGNGMMGDDAAGPLLAHALKRDPLDNWEVLNGESAPENCIHILREIAPEQVLIVDAADMGLPPGEIRRIAEARIGSFFLMTTHSLPLTYLMQSIREFVPQVDLVGIQPAVVAFGYPISSQVKQAVDRFYNCLKQDEWKHIEEAPDETQKALRRPNPPAPFPKMKGEEGKNLETSMPLEGTPSF